MSWSTDTDYLLQSGTVVIVKNPTYSYTATSVTPTTSATIIETSTVLIFPNAGGYKKEIKGRVIESTHLTFFPSTSSVAVGHRFYEPDETDFHEVLKVGDYDGHKEIDSEKVEKR